MEAGVRQAADYSGRRRRGSVASFGMRRPLANAIAFFCVLVQLALGVSSLLGLVLCVGEDHAAIEIASDDCCAGADEALSDDCCSDIPLYAAAQQVPEVQRAAPAMLAAAAVAPFAGDTGRRVGRAVSLTPVPPFGVGSVVLRV